MTPPDIETLELTHGMGEVLFENGYEVFSVH